MEKSELEEIETTNENNIKIYENNNINSENNNIKSITFNKMKTK